LGFVVGQGKHHALVGSGVHDASGSKPLGQDSGAWRQAVASTAVQDHPWRPTPSGTSEHRGSPGTPRRSSPFFEGFQFGAQPRIFQHDQPIGFIELAPVLKAARGIQPGT
jgi:hypothetical protein